ncbi:MAG: ATP/GTP-binding protein [Cyanobacteria bacterium J06641_2]
MSSEILRIVVTGGVGAGKTTFIRTISEIDVVDTDKRATDELAELKEKTTVALDFGKLTITPTQSLHLYGTPGQSRFDFMWDILIKKAHAYILLIDAHRPNQFREARKLLNFMNQNASIPELIGITHTDCAEAWEIEDIALALGLQDEIKSIPIMAINPNERESVFQALIAIVEQLESAPQTQL